ncbi:MAG: hypothetical protein M1361_01170 [Patescibacteria group bacterium]|nr:hypothetical protein [Patescibacteria group bacterium]MCL5224214.1 hypothetical protein [Patescibacteria group bacterium]
MKSKMTDQEFKEKCEKHREKLKVLLNSGFFELKNTKVEVNFGPKGEIGDWSIVRQSVYKRP